MVDAQAITEPLIKLVRAKTGDDGAQVSGVSPLPGHAGFGYSFFLERSRAATPSS